MLISKIISLVTSTNGDYIKIKKINEKKQFFEELANLLSDIKKKIFVTLLVICVTTVIYWYFIFIFCTIYQHNQIGWIQSSLISIVINSIIPILLCFLISGLRFLALHWNNR